METCVNDDDDTQQFARPSLAAAALADEPSLGLFGSPLNPGEFSAPKFTPTGLRVDVPASVAVAPTTKALVKVGAIAGAVVLVLVFVLAWFTR